MPKSQHGTTPKHLLACLEMVTAPTFSPQAAAPETAVVHQKRVRRALEDPNIVGVGISNKWTDDEETADLTLCFYVVKKKTLKKMAPQYAIPPVIATPGGAAAITDVKVVGNIVPQINARKRPLKSGYSIGHAREDAAGTLGAIVKKGKKLYVLSNSHVLARSGKAAKGDGIVYPGRLDGGKAKTDTVARLSHFVPFKVGNDFLNRVDAALAEINAERLGDIDFSIAALKALGTVKPARDMHVVKVGRTTGRTESVVEDINFRVIIRYPGVGKVGFLDQVLCRTYTDGGDSGSVVVDKASGKIVGLHFAGSPKGSVFTPIDFVMQSLGFRFTRG